MKKAILVLGLMAAAGFGVWRWRGWAPEPKHDAKLVLDRIWIDHVPRNDRDVIQVFAALSEEAFGVFNATSQWRGSFEVFRHETRGDEIRAMYPQTGDREKIRAKATRCDEREMDYCLELSGASRGVKKYYSRKGWEIDGKTSVHKLRHRIADITEIAGTLR
jgi:hypothetical protein